jgi:hypothetical protein
MQRVNAAFDDSSPRLLPGLSRAANRPITMPPSRRDSLKNHFKNNRRASGVARGAGQMAPYRQPCARRAALCDQLPRMLPQHRTVDLQRRGRKSLYDAISPYDENNHELFLLAVAAAAAAAAAVPLAVGVTLGGIFGGRAWWRCQRPEPAVGYGAVGDDRLGSVDQRASETATPVSQEQERVCAGYRAGHQDLQTDPLWTSARARARAETGE